MYLKRLEIYGFKSFGTKSVLDFDHADKLSKISAIVGPNGSGKSNIADAVRWVLGEQSSKLLRSKKNEDVIFCGSNSKSRSSYAEISMILSDKVATEIEIAGKKHSLTEIEITRKLYRTGESEYLINRKKVRLLDIGQLLASLGFGQSSYTVLGQGMVDRMLFFTPSERKVLFDEAAGVKQYEIKREQALRKLEGTDGNIIRLRDILSELEPRVVNLRRLVKRAEGRKEFEVELLEIQSKYYKSVQLELTEKIEKFRKDKENLNKKIIQFESEIRVLEEKIHTKEKSTDTQLLSQLETEITAITTERDNLLQRVAFIEGQLNHFEEKNENFAKETERLRLEEQSLAEKVSFLEQKIAEEREVMQFEESEKEKLAMNLGELEAKKEALDEKLVLVSQGADGRNLEMLQEDLKKIEIKKREVTNEFYHLNQKKSLFETGAKRSLERKDRLESEIKRISGELERQRLEKGEKEKHSFSLKEDLEKAKKSLSETIRKITGIEKDLSELVSQINQEQIEQFDKEITQTLKEYKEIEDKIKVDFDQNILRGYFTKFFANLDSVFAKIRKITSSLNKNEREKIENELKDLRSQQKEQEVKIQKLMVEIDRLASFGELTDERIKNFNNKIEELKAELTGLEIAEFDENDIKVLASLDNEISTINTEIEKLSNEIREKTKGVSEKRQEILSEKDLLHREETELRQKIYEFEVSIGRKNSLIENQERELAGSNIRLSEIAERLKEFSEVEIKKDARLEKELIQNKEALAQKNDQLSGLRGKLSEVLARQREKNQETLGLERKRRELETGVIEANNQIAQVSIDEARYLTRDEDLKEEITLSSISLLPEVRGEILDQSIKDNLRVKIENLKRKLETIGGVDPETVTEYEELSLRSTEMAEQLNDLEKAKGDLESIIKELDVKIKKQFSETFSQIATEFNRYFTILFNGGKANLALGEDEEGSFGIEITANPPGKRLQNLSALSGGERTLTSLALLFAILSINPSPFCVLDEVDAALDESNTIRFAKILKDLAVKTQFLVISHNRETMKAADTIYGITMDSDHISKMISIRLAEALEKVAV